MPVIIENDYHNQIKNKLAQTFKPDTKFIDILYNAISEYEKDSNLGRNAKRKKEIEKIKGVSIPSLLKFRTVSELSKKRELDADDYQQSRSNTLRKEFDDYRLQLLAIFEGQERGLQGDSKLQECVLATLSVYEERVLWPALRELSSQEDKNRVMINCIQRAAWRLRGELLAGTSPDIQGQIDAIDKAAEVLKTLELSFEEMTPQLLYKKLLEKDSFTHADLKYINAIDDRFSSYLNEEFASYQNGKAFRFPQEELMEMKIPVKRTQADGNEVTEEKTFLVTKWSPVVFNPKKVIIALHGWRDSADMWRAYAAEKIKEGYTVYAYDQESFGFTPERFQRDQGQTIDINKEVLRNNFEAFASYIQQHPTGNPLETSTETILNFAGHSMGAAVLLASRNFIEDPKRCSDNGKVELFNPAFYPAAQKDTLVENNFFKAAKDIFSYATSLIPDPSFVSLFLIGLISRREAHPDVKREEISNKRFDNTSNTIINTFPSLTTVMSEGFNFAKQIARERKATKWEIFAGARDAAAPIELVREVEKVALENGNTNMSFHYFQHEAHDLPKGLNSPFIFNRKKLLIEKAVETLKTGTNVQTFQSIPEYDLTLVRDSNQYYVLDNADLTYYAIEVEQQIQSEFTNKTDGDHPPEDGIALLGQTDQKPFVEIIKECIGKFQPSILAPENLNTSDLAAFYHWKRSPFNLNLLLKCKNQLAHDKEIVKSLDEFIDAVFENPLLLTNVLKKNNLALLPGTEEYFLELFNNWFLVQSSQDSSLISHTIGNISDRSEEAKEWARLLIETPRGSLEAKKQKRFFKAIEENENLALNVYSYLENNTHFSEVNRTRIVGMVALAKIDISGSVAKKILASRDEPGSVFQSLSVEQFSEIKNLKSAGEIFYLQSAKKSSAEVADQFWKNLRKIKDPIVIQSFVRDFSLAAAAKEKEITPSFPGFTGNEVIQSVFKKSHERELHVMDKPPASLKDYEGSYILIQGKNKKEETEEKLYYINSTLKPEEVPIQDLAEFKTKLGIKEYSKKTIYLSKEKILELITSKGGHIPEGNNYPQLIANASVEVAASLVNQVSGETKSEIISLLTPNIRMKLFENGTLNAETLKAYEADCKVIEAKNSYLKNRAIERIDDYLNHHKFWRKDAKETFYRELLEDMKKPGSDVFKVLEKHLSKTVRPTAFVPREKIDKDEKRNLIFYKRFGDKVDSRAAKCMFDLIELITAKKLTAEQEIDFVENGKFPGDINELQKGASPAAVDALLGGSDAPKNSGAFSRKAEAIYHQIILNKALVLAKAHPESVLFDPQGHILIDVKLDFIDSPEKKDIQELTEWIEKCGENVFPKSILDRFKVLKEKAKIKSDRSSPNRDFIVAESLKIINEAMTIIKDTIPHYFKSNSKKVVHCNLDIIDHPELLKSFKEWVTQGVGDDENDKNNLDGALDELLKHEGRGSIIALQQEMQLFFKKQLRALEATFNEEDLNPRWADINLQVKKNVNKSVQKKFRETLLVCYQEAIQSGEFDREKFLSLMIDRQDIARKTCAKEGLKFLIEKLDEKEITIKKLNDACEDGTLKTNFINLPATENDQLYTCSADNMSTRISGTSHTSHDKREGKDYMALRSIHDCFMETDSSGNITIQADNEDQILFRVPSLSTYNKQDKKAGTDDATYAEDVSNKLNQIKLLAKQQRGDKETPLFYDLLTSLPRDIDPSDADNRQKESARRIFKGMHLCNQEKVGDENFNRFVFVINVPINQHGHALSENTLELSANVVKEANLLAEMGVLANLHEQILLISSAEQRAYIEAYYKTIVGQYKEFLKAPNRTELFVDSDQGHEAVKFLAEFKKGLYQIMLREQSDVDQTKRIPQSIRAMALNALARLFAEGNHREEENGALFQALSIFTANTVVAGCKSANERNQAVMGRVQALKSISLRSQQGKALTTQEDTLVDKLNKYSRYVEVTEKDAYAHCLNESLDKIYRDKLQQSIAMIAPTCTGGASKYTVGGPILNNTNKRESDAYKDRSYQTKGGELQDKRGFKMFEEALGRVEKRQNPGCWARLFEIRVTPLSAAEQELRVSASPRT